MEGVVSRTLACLLLAAALPGCGWFEGDERQEFEEDLPTLDSAVTSAAAVTTETSEDLESARGATADQPAISPGMRVPLHRRVVQTLSQDDVVSRTTLDLDFTISIDEIVEDGRRRYGVHYHRVRYSGEVGGEKFEYDSKKKSTPAPYQALPFCGLVDNSFYFWIDGGGQAKLVGFDRFLRRCVEGLPQADREAVLSRLSVISDAEGVCRFVDETIGLLEGAPLKLKNGDALKAGATWKSHRKLPGSVPMQIVTDYTVKTASGQDVEIDIHGIVAPYREAVLPAAGGGFPQVTVTAGQTMGLCKLDRTTGLPTSSQIEQVIDMSVNLADDVSFEQRKRVVSTTKRVEAR